MQRCGAGLNTECRVCEAACTPGTCFQGSSALSSGFHRRVAVTGGAYWCCVCVSVSYGVCVGLDVGVLMRAHVCRVCMFAHGTCFVHLQAACCWCVLCFASAGAKHPVLWPQQRQVACTLPHIGCWRVFVLVGARVVFAAQQQLRVGFSLFSSRCSSSGLLHHCSHGVGGRCRCKQPRWSLTYSHVSDSIQSGCCVCVCGCHLDT